MRLPLIAPDHLKASCAACYEQPALRLLLGDTLHPGGLRTTEQLIRGLRPQAGDRVLDVACGPGRTAAYISGRFGCRVTGVEYSLKTAAEARQGKDGRVSIVAGDGERLPFRDGCFDAALIECSLSLVPDKPSALAEMLRVLRPGGRIGVADLALQRALPAELPPVLTWNGCVGGALSGGQYAQLLQGAGFEGITVEDASWALTEMLERAGRMLLLVDLAQRFGKLSGWPIAPAQLRGYLHEAQLWITGGDARYLILAAQKP